jgi:hypothetical protein
MQYPTSTCRGLDHRLRYFALNGTDHRSHTEQDDAAPNQT